MPPAPGMIASLVSGRPTVALEARRRKVLLRASSKPPPRASEEMALMVGMGRRERVVRVVRRVVRKVLVLRARVSFRLFVDAGLGRGGGGGNVLWAFPPRPPFQIRPGAETVVGLSRG